MSAVVCLPACLRVSPQRPVARPPTETRHHISAIVDSTHVYITKPQDPALCRVLWFNKGDKEGHAIVFNVFINWVSEVIACSWWYPPKAYDADMTRDMDAVLPWV